MGMFDRVFAKLECPECKTVQYDEVQTKAFRNLLDSYEIGDRIKAGDFDMKSGKIDGNFLCQNCDNLFDVDIVIEDNKIQDVEIKVMKDEDERDG